MGILKQGDCNPIVYKGKYVYTRTSILSTIFKKVPAHSFFKESPTLTQLAPILTFLFPIPASPSHLFLNYFRQFPPPSRRQPSSCSNPTHEPFLHIHTGSFLDNLEFLFIKSCCRKK